MANLLQQAGKNLGNWSDYFGTNLRLPEFGVSEALAQEPTMNTSTPGTTVEDMNMQTQGVLSSADYVANQPGGSQYVAPATTSNVVNSNLPPIPTPEPTTQSPDDIWQSVYQQVYPGWGQTEAYANWVALGKPMPQAPGTMSVADLEAQLTSDLNEAYQPAMDVLGQQEQYLRQAQPGALKGIEDTYALRKGEQEGDFLSTQEQSELNKRKLWNEKEDVLASSRRLYDELRRGGRQRFGGTSSAGEAMETLLGREQQRQMGQTQRTYMNNIAEWQRSKADVDRSYRQNLQQLNLAKDEAVRKSNDTFNSGLMEIMSSKAGLETEKGLRRLDLLTNLRDSIMKAEQTANEWKQRLDYQREIADMNFAYRLKEIQAQAQYKAYAPPKSSYSVVDYGGQDRIMDKTTGQFLDTTQGQISSDEDKFDKWLQGA